MTVAIAIVFTLAIDALAASLAASVCCALLRRGAAARTRAAVRRAWREERRGLGLFVATALVLALLTRGAAGGGLIAAGIVGSGCGGALLGLGMLAVAGRNERRGRLAVARRLARAAVPWIVAGSLVAAGLAIAAGPIAGVVLLLAAGATGALGGLARKPRPAAGIALVLHAAGAVFAAGAWSA